MEKLKQKAFSLGASGFGKSNTKGKRFYVIYKGKRINFGAEGASTFLEHKDPIKRKAWIARHSKIRNKEGRIVINDKNSASFWSSAILW